MRFKGFIGMVALLLVFAFATAWAFQDTSQLKNVWTKDLRIESGGTPASYVTLTEIAGPTLYVNGAGDEMNLLVNGHATVEGNIASYVHTVDGQSMELFLLRLQKNYRQNRPCWNSVRA